MKARMNEGMKAGDKLDYCSVSARGITVIEERVYSRKGGT